MGTKYIYTARILEVSSFFVLDEVQISKDNFKGVQNERNYFFTYFIRCDFNSI